jgi:hypothetical protein
VSPTAVYGLGLALGVTAVATSLLGWQWAEAKSRPEEDAAAEAEHYSRRFVRRSAASYVMIGLAVLILVGSTTDHLVGGRANPVFVGAWLAAFVLVFVLLTLAAADWVSVRRFARRRRAALVREGVESLRRALVEAHGDGPAAQVNGSGRPHPS